MQTSHKKGIIRVILIAQELRFSF